MTRAPVINRSTFLEHRGGWPSCSLRNNSNNTSPGAHHDDDPGPDRTIGGRPPSPSGSHAAADGRLLGGHRDDRDPAGRVERAEPALPGVPGGVRVLLAHLDRHLQRLRARPAHQPAHRRAALRRPRPPRRPGPGTVGRGRRDGRVLGRAQRRRPLRRPDRAGPGDRRSRGRARRLPAGPPARDRIPAGVAGQQRRGDGWPRRRSHRDRRTHPVRRVPDPVDLRPPHRGLPRPDADHGAAAGDRRAAGRRLAALRPRVSVPATARRAFARAVPTMASTWMLGGLFFSVGATRGRDREGRRPRRPGGAEARQRPPAVLFVLGAVPPEPWLRPRLPRSRSRR